MKPKRLARLLFCLIALCFFASPTWSIPYETPALPVETWRGDWHDTRRDRDVPVKIYYPTSTGPFPVVLFSHGLGGSCEGYEYLGRYWAEHGYIAVHLQHIGSDDSLWRNGGVENLRNGISLKTTLDRPRDVSFVIDQLEIANKKADWPLHGKLDLAHIGMAGHSFGANTTMLVAGYKFPNLNLKLADKRIKCAVAMSIPPTLAKDYDALYRKVKIPILHMTGTRDTSSVDPVGSTAADRRIPYDHINRADAYLITFTGGDHMLFSGRNPLRRETPTDERNHLLIQQASTAFWDTYLKSDPKALAWLRTNFTGELGRNGVFEQKAGK